MLRNDPQQLHKLGSELACWFDSRGLGLPMAVATFSIMIRDIFLLVPELKTPEAIETYSRMLSNALGTGQKGLEN